MTPQDHYDDVILGRRALTWRGASSCSYLSEIETAFSKIKTTLLTTPFEDRAFTSWRSAWRSIRHKAARSEDGELIYPELQTVRFHDLRHTAVTTMAEKGLPEQTIMAQVGHVSPQMLKTYSHIRRQALNLAAAALEPAFLRTSTSSADAELIN